MTPPPTSYLLLYALQSKVHLQYSVKSEDLIGK